MLARTLALTLLLTGCPATAEKRPDDGADTADTDTDTDTDTDADTDTDTDTDTTVQDVDGDGYSVDDGDCDDTDPYRYPTAAEICNGVDDDCDGAIDDDAVPVSWYHDGDGDGAGDAASSFSSCEPPVGYVRAGDDCDDADSAVHPGAAERCGGVDEDCDGLLDGDDPDLADAPTWYYDADGDGYGGTSGAVTSCVAPIGYIGDGGDCDDGDATVNPVAVERCDSSDSDCDGVSDDDDATDRSGWYTDGDADGFGDEASVTLACSAPAGTTGIGGDCDDADVGVNPDAAETCGDGVDNDCDGGAGSCHPTGDVDPGSKALATIYGDGSYEPLGVSAVVADFDDDGTDDLAISRSSTSEVFLFSASISGDYLADDAPVVIESDGAADPLASPGDMTGDGIPDLVVCNPSGRVDYNLDGVVSLVAGPIVSSMDAEDGEARFNGTSNIEAGLTIATPGDVTGDGLADLYLGSIAEYGDPEQIFLAEGGTTGDFNLTTATTIFEAPFANSYMGTEAIYAEDVDGDGVSDLLATAFQGGSTLEGAVYLFLGPAPGGVVPASAADGRILTPSLGWRLSAGDADNDGRADIVYEDSSKASVFFSPPSGDVDSSTASWTATLADPTAEAGGMLAGADFDGDGAGELLLEETGNYVADSRVCGWYGPLLAGTSSCDTADFRLVRSGEMTRLGHRLAPVTDVSGDGLPELLVTEPYNYKEAVYGGAAYLLSVGGL